MKRSLDKVLSFLQRDSSHGEVTKIYYRPSRDKCIMGLILSFLLFLVMCLLCVTSFSIGCFLMLLVSIVLLTFYGLNVFTKDGFWIPRYVNKSMLEELNEDDDLEDEGE